MDIMAILEALHQKNVKMQDEGYGNLAGFQKMVSGSTDTAKNYADGGMADPQTPPVMPIGDLMKSMSQTPPTDYSFYKNISADDRANLAKQLMQQQHSAPQLMGEGIAGIGDAIRNSYGGQTGARGMKDIQERGQKNTDDQLSAFDTQRTQKLQDLEANRTVALRDPNHPLAAGMREILKSQGINAPSGMDAETMMKVLGPLGELSYKQAMMGMTGMKQKADVENDKTARKLEAAKGLENRNVFRKAADFFSPSQETQAMQDVISNKQAPASHGIPDVGSTFNGGTIKKVTRIDHNG